MTIDTQTAVNPAPRLPDGAARWVSAPELPKDNRTLYFRHEVDLPAAVVRGRAYVTALGWYKLEVNGIDLTGDALVPRWTPFDAYVEYQTHDVTAAFTAGPNVVGMVVADGRFRGRLGVFGRSRQYGDRLAAFVRMDLELADGSTVTIATDDSWQVGTGAIRTADPMNGERVDAGLLGSDWSRPGGSVVGVQPVEVLDEQRTLIPEEVAPVTSIARLAPVAISRTPSGRILVDFGQNFAGVVRIDLPAGSGTVVLKYSEVLTPSGELDEHYLGLGGSKKEWFQRDEVTLGTNSVRYQPRFTIHGFRYVTIEGLPGDLAPEAIEGVVLSSDLRAISTFTASDPRLEQLWRNVGWSLRSNFTDTPTDCPTRERSGWTGDIQIFGSTAVQLVDAGAYLRRYLRNVATEQRADGRVPPFIPAEESPGRTRNMLGFTSTSVGWGDVTVMLPWALYWYRGDREVLEQQYDSAKAWVDSLARRARKRGRSRWLARPVGDLEQYVLASGYNWGEWLRPDDNPMRELAVNVLKGRPAVATAYFANSARLLARIAEVLGKADDARHYADLAEKVRRAYNAAFVRESGARIGDDRQDDYVRALAFDLLPVEHRPAAVSRLVELIEQAGDHLATGFLSTALLLPTLVDHGRTDVAMRLLLQDTAPSWLSLLKQGATTIWETWEGYDAKGNAQFSHNHYSLGAVAQFLQERLAGLAPAEPGYRRIRIAPIVDSPITAASTSTDTPLGLASVGWEVTDGVLTVHARVPDGGTAVLELPGCEPEELPAGDHDRTLTLG